VLVRRAAGRRGLSPGVAPDCTAAYAEHVTNPRFLPSAGLLLAIAACSPDFAVTLPSTLDSLMTLGGWVAEEGAAPPPEADEV